jgi:DNA transposition AAA+ family ATPase
MVAKEHWKVEPDEHDYPAGRDYLTLVTDEATASRLVDAMKAAALTLRKAKDLLRASGLPLLPEANVHVAKDLEKVRKGHKLSPVLLVRGDFARNAPLVIADGYHRVCASYHLDEDADIPCRLVDAPSG